MMLDSLNRALLRDAIKPALWTLLGGSAIAAVIGGVRCLGTEAVVPDLATFGALTSLAIPISWSIIIPIAALAGYVLALAKWVDEGAWTGLSAMGKGGRTLLPSAISAGVLVAVGTASMTLWLEPAARQLARGQLLEASAGYSLSPGATLEIGGMQIRASAMEDGWARELLFSNAALVGMASRGRLVSTKYGLALELERGSMATLQDPPTRISWDRWVRPLPPIRPPRLEIHEQTTRGLSAQAKNSEQLGLNAYYEWAVFWKRFFHPLAALLLPMAMMPLATRKRPAMAIGAISVGYLVAVRLGDTLAFGVGGILAAMSGPLFITLAGLVLWWAWRDR
ncbi:MAG: LptF/LptG family permease [Proteobacteria bacterium]|nr:LptF/LptG family permease [Pseudomonadota bacterium]